MWSYYGSKANIIHLYPPPKYGKVIEPFAGSARYALRYWDRDITIVDSYDVIIRIWQWLQKCSEGDIKKLPRIFKQSERIDDVKFDCDEAKLLMGFLFGKGAERPRKKIVDRITLHRPNYVNYHLKRIASHLQFIRHWKIVLGDYREIDNTEATWFIDPPYQHGGAAYVKSSRSINFPELAEWCRSRNGQIIVCENTKADWMEFKPLVKQRGSVKTTTESVWTNHLFNTPVSSNQSLFP